MRSPGDSEDVLSTSFHSLEPSTPKYTTQTANIGIQCMLTPMTAPSDLGEWQLCVNREADRARNFWSFYCQEISSLVADENQCY